MTTCGGKRNDGEILRDRVPCSTGIYNEKPDSGPSSDRSRVDKLLIYRNVRELIPYMGEQRNKSDEQGDNIDDQRIKTAEHGRRDNRP
jgi:hypothetical protein